MRSLGLIASVIALTFCSFGILAKSQAQEPVVVKAAAAIYPPIAAAAEESGTVTVAVEINIDGAVASATAVDGHKLFWSAAESGARKWLFKPSEESKELRTARLTFHFKFISRGATPEELLPVYLPPYGVEIKGVAPNYTFHKNVDPPNMKIRRAKSKKH